MKIERFPLLAEYSGVSHAFTTRSAFSILEDVDAERQQVLSVQFPMARAVQGEQPHGNGVAIVAGGEENRVKIAGVDALVTSMEGVPLVIRVADCGAIYFFDPVKRVIGLAHSGRKGTELNIARATIDVMKREMGSRPEDLRVVLSPCIRPPHYEIDFAATIGRQMRELDVQFYEDCGICTASHLDRYYSYRAEKGQMLRLWAILMLNENS